MYVHLKLKKKHKYFKHYKAQIFGVGLSFSSALKDHEKSDLDPDQDHLPKSDLRSRSDPDLT